MGALRDQIAADLAAILSNEDELGGLVTVDGVQVPGLLDEDTAGAAPRTSAGRNAEGVYLAEKVLYVAATDLARPPVVDQRLTVNGVRYRVAHVGSSMGLLAVRLSAWES